MALIDFLKSALLNSNVQAGLKTIRESEGSAAEDGYSYLFSSSPRNDVRFKDYSKHPNIKMPYGTTFSTAAGAYQIMYNTWVDIQKQLNLPDFSPASQDIACCFLISQRNCLQKLMDGGFDAFVAKCNTIWASLPGSPYGQPTHDIAKVQKWYEENGGVIA